MDKVEYYCHHCHKWGDHKTSGHQEPVKPVVIVDNTKVTNRGHQVLAS